MRWIPSSKQSGQQHANRPPAAVDLSPQGALAAALPGKGAPPVYAFAPLPPGALTPSIVEVNLHAVDAVIAAIRNTLGNVEPRTRAVTLIVPDAVVRVFVLDFDSLPGHANEVIPVLRFRLRKMVSFDVEQAGVSYQILSQDETECRVLVAVMPGPILAEYEAAVRAAGYEPGAVLSSSLAALSAVDAQQPVLAACLSGSSLTTAIANGQDLLLYRTLDLPADPGLLLSEVQRDIAVAAAYFEDKLAARPHSLHFAGAGTAAEFARWLNEPELTVVELAPRPTAGAATSLGNVSFAGITGALAGVA